MCCQPSTTAQLVGYCICGVMRIYTGAAGLVVPHNGPVRLACHRVRTHPSEKPCASSVGTRSHSEAPCADAPPVKRRQRTLLALAARWRKWFACGNSHASSSCLAHEPNPRPARDQHTSSTRTHSQGYQLDTEQYHSTPSSVRLLTALRTRANGTCCFPYQRAGSACWRKWSPPFATPAPLGHVMNERGLDKAESERRMVLPPPTSACWNRWYHRSTSPARRSRRAPASPESLLSGLICVRKGHNCKGTLMAEST